LINGNKLIDSIILDEMIEIKRKIIWVPAEEPLTLTARLAVNGWEVGVYDDDLIPVHKWSHNNNCGCRISFDQFRFRTEAEMTMFLLKWG
jgi:hypothetical protein